MPDAFTEKQEDLAQRQNTAHVVILTSWFCLLT